MLFVEKTKLKGGNSLNIRELLNRGYYVLKNNKIETPKQKARLIMQYVLNKPKEYIVIYDSKQVSKEDEEKYMNNINKLCKGTPIQYITNFQEFMNMSFYVNKNVLIPRQDTEVLVEEVISLAKNKTDIKILDLCTGSGIIGISLSKNLKDSEVYASDISEGALKVARQNNDRNGTDVKYIHSNLFENIPEMKFDYIVSNPPYIKTDVIDTLSDEVRKEPILALDGGYDGLKFYTKIAKQAIDYLKYGGYLCLEIGYDQKDDVIDILKSTGNYTKIYCKKDLCDNDRIIIAKVGD